MLKIKAKTVLLTTMDRETNHLLYPYISAINDIFIREISLASEIHTIINSESLKEFLIPEMYLENLSDNIVILEWWVAENDTSSEMRDEYQTGILQKSQMVEYRFSLYQGSDGLSRVIDRGTLPSGNILLNLDERNRIINNLVDYLHE